MTKANAAAEPSMEEILASIRRIISDGDEGGARESAVNINGAAEPERRVDALKDDAEGEDLIEENDEIFELTDSMLADEPFFTPNEVSAGGHDMEPHRDVSHTEMRQVQPIEPDIGFSSDDVDAPLRAGPQLRPTTTPQEEGNAAGEQGGEGEAAVADDGAEHLMSPATDAKVAATFSRLANTILMNDARTLDDLVKEMLRPMLRDWLDDNLPGLVERLVREEIERVSRGRG